MYSKKYKLTDSAIKIGESVLYQIEALVDIGKYVKRGDRGGYVEAECNLSHYDGSWIYGNAKVYGNAEVSGNAKVSGNAEVSGNAKVYGNAEVSGDSEVSGNAKVSGNAELYGCAKVFGFAKVYGNAKVYDNAELYGFVRVFGDSELYGFARVFFDSEVSGNALVSKTPIIISGLCWNITITDEEMKIGCQQHSFIDWRNFTDCEISRMDSEALSFWKNHKDALLSLCKFHEQQN